MIIKFKTWRNLLRKIIGYVLLSGFLGSALILGLAEGKCHPGCLEMNYEDIKKIQELLKARDFDPGPIDGIYGSKTINSLRAFQESKGLRNTGKINVDTLIILGKESTNVHEISLPMK